MSAVTKLMTAGGGGVSLTPASSIASDVTVNIPSSNGTLVSTGETAQVSQAMLASGVAGNGPAFSAYLYNSQNLSAGVFTKIQIATEDFDTANCYDSATNYRFTPNVAGYYQVNLSVYISGSWQAGVCAEIYKNGGPYVGAWTNMNGVTMDATPSMSAVIYMNGTTDYLEAYAFGTTGTPAISGLASIGTRGACFSASLVRAS